MGTPGPSGHRAPSGVATRRVLDLPPEPGAVRAARRMLRELLHLSGHDEWAEPAELACTELVTNAVLHAHTHITVTVEVQPDELRVAVSDGSRDLPRQRAGDAQATTGRGMLLVARLVTEHGARREDTGKTVWFTLRTSPGPPGGEPSPDDLLSLWADDTPGTSEDAGPGPGTAGDPSAASAAAEAPGSTRVLLVGLPPTLWLAAAEHHQTVLRELVLYLAEHRDLAVDMAPVDAARTLLDDAVAGAVDQARREGTARRPLPEDHPGDLPWVPDLAALTLAVPPGAVPFFAAMQDTLDLAERLATDGQLLARPGLPEIVALRDWACEQVLAQLGGAPPAPWPGTDHERFLAQDAVGTAGEGVEVVRSSPVPAVAADDSNRIVAVSRAMAAATGWEVDDLVGRRIVTLIPPRLREAHVAGFSRHLSTGEARLLGVPLELPVLRADGTEVRCGVLIEEAATEHGRRLYLAWFHPLPDPADAPRPGATGDR